MSRKVIITGVVIVALIAIGIFMFSKPNASAYTTLGSYNEEIEIYKGGSCGCCGVYVNYFMNKGNKNVQVKNAQDIGDIKEKYGIPAAMESCHTTIIGDYFIEGHMPLEAVEKLLTEKPDIAGIAMPGMPEGSPGMVGSKKGDFVIYAVNRDGSYQEWMRI